MQSPHGEPPPRLGAWLLALSVLAVVFFCYGPALHGSILWDDPAHIPRPELQGWTGLARIWTDFRATQQYYPVLFSAFWLEHRLWGGTTLGYHVTNGVLHSLSACLLGWIVWRLTRPSGNGASPRASRLGAWLAALLFAAHPVCVESVAWITEQKNTLSLAFYLLAAAVYLEFDDRRSWKAYLLATGCFLLALGSKTSTVTLPAALLVLFWWRRGRLDGRRDVRPLLPWFAASVAAGLLTSWIERTFIGAEGVDFDLRATERVLLAGRVVWFYLGKLLWPAGLNFFYPRWDAARSIPVWLGCLVAAAAVTVVLWLIRRRTRGPLAVWLLFVGGLFPVLGLFKVFFFVFSYVNDHFVYLPGAALLAGVAAGLSGLLARAPRALRTGGLVACLAVVGVLALLSRRQSRLYTDNETLFRETLARNPDAWMAHLILGFEYGKSPERRAEALAECRRAVEMKPTYAEAQFALAVELARSPGGSDEAIRHYERALQLWPEKFEAHVNLGVELAKRPGRLPDAIRHYEAALRIRPDDAETQNNLANALARLPERAAEALAHYEQALRLRPDYPEARNNLGVELARLPGRGDEARRQFEAALEANPGFAEAHAHLAALLAKDPARLPDALAHYQEAVRIKPDDAEVRFRLAGLLATLPARRAEAVVQYERALRSAPEFAPGHYDLANLYARMPGRADAAIAQYEAALALKPDFAEAHANLANVLAGLPGRVEEAIRHDEAALRIDPSLGWVRLNRLMHLSAAPGRESEAIAAGEDLLRRQPENVAAHNALAVVHARRGEWAASKVLWERVLQIDPRNEAARQNLKRLEQLRGAGR